MTNTGRLSIITALISSILVFCQQASSLHGSQRGTITMTSNTVLPVITDLNLNRDIILGSASPRRKELMALMGFTNFRVQTSNFAENLVKSSYPSAAEYCVATSLEKGNAIASGFGRGRIGSLHSILICADTIVEIAGAVLEKPVNSADAKCMLRSLSGREHQVHSGVSIFATKNTGSLEKLDAFSVSTTVKFVSLSDSDIDAYLLTEEPFDKAGSYGIQGYGGQFVESISGCYFNVMGFPLSALSKRLSEHYHRGLL